MDDVQEVQVSREARMPGATVAAERTGTYLPRVLESTRSVCSTWVFRDSERLFSLGEWLTQYDGFDAIRTGGDDIHRDTDHFLDLLDIGLGGCR